MIEKILQEKRFYFYVIATFFIPLILTFFLLQQKQQNLLLKRDKIQMILQKARKQQPKREAVVNFLKKHTDVDESYVENTIESLSFLNCEKERLKPVVSHPAFKEETLTKRFEFLNNGKNNLEFLEEQPKKTTLCKETVIKQKRPIEIDKNDLIALLNLIENSEEKKPQLLIQHIALEKNKENNFIIKMDLLKREFSK